MTFPPVADATPDTATPAVAGGMPSPVTAPGTAGTADMTATATPRPRIHTLTVIYETPGPHGPVTRTGMCLLTETNLLDYGIRLITGATNAAGERIIELRASV